MAFEVQLSDGVKARVNDGEWACDNGVDLALLAKHASLEAARMWIDNEGKSETAFGGSDGIMAHYATRLLGGRVTGFPPHARFVEY